MQYQREWDSKFEKLQHSFPSLPSLSFSPFHFLDVSFPFPYLLQSGTPVP